MNSSDVYYGCGLTFRSDVPLVGVPRALSGHVSVDIKWGHVAVQDSEPLDEQKWFQGRPGRLVFQVPGIARYQVSEGTEILVDPMPGADELDVQIFLLGSAFGALLHQRANLPLHASTVRVGDSYVAFVGQSGDGKSTQAALLHEAGFPLAGDDICPVLVDANDHVTADFGFPRLKLWSDALNSMGIAKEGLRKSDYDRDKYELPTRSESEEQRLPLAAIYVLGYTDDLSSAQITRVTGQRCLPLLLQHTYRYGFVEPLGCTERHFCLCLGAARSVPIFQLQRATGFEYAANTTEMLQNHWENLGLCAAPAAVL